MKLDKYISKEVCVVLPQDTVAHVRNLFLKKKISCVLVYDKKPIGIITEKELADAFVKERRSIDQILAKEITNKDFLKIHPEASVGEIAKLMISKKGSHVVLVRNDDIYGIITKTDLVRYFAENLKDKVFVENLMTEKVETITEMHSLFQAAKRMREKGIEKLVVVDGKKPVGIVSQRDISLASLGLYPSKVILIRKAGDKIHHHEKIMPAIVADIMKTNVETITKDEDCAEAAKKMLDKRIGSLIVADSNGYLQGIITKTDLVRWMAENCK